MQRSPRVTVDRLDQKGRAIRTRNPRANREKRSRKPRANRVRNPTHRILRPAPVRARRRATRKASRSQLREPGLASLDAGSSLPLQIDSLQIVAKRAAEIRPPQCEVHDRLQKSQLVASVVTDAVDPASVDRP